MSRTLRRATDRPTRLSPFCVCGMIQHPTPTCNAFEAKTPDNSWRVPDRRGHATVAPCRCSSCDRDTAAAIARDRESHGELVEEKREQREAVEAISGRRKRLKVSEI